MRTQVSRQEVSDDQGMERTTSSTASNDRAVTGFGTGGVHTHVRTANHPLPVPLIPVAACPHRGESLRCERARWRATPAVQALFVAYQRMLPARPRVSVVIAKRAAARLTLATGS